MSSGGWYWCDMPLHIYPEVQTNLTYDICKRILDYLSAFLSVWSSTKSHCECFFRRFTMYGPVKRENTNLKSNTETYYTTRQEEEEEEKKNRGEKCSWFVIFNLNHDFLKIKHIYYSYFVSGCNENESEHLDRDQQAYAPSQKTKRMRTSFKHHQLRTMKSYFAINHNPDAKDLKQLAQKTGLTKRVLQVSVGFCLLRKKKKKKNTPRSYFMCPL